MKRLANTPLWVVLALPVAVIVLLISLLIEHWGGDHHARGRGINGHHSEADDHGHGDGANPGDRLKNAVDVGFVQSMLLHHAQALQMTRLVEAHATGEVAILARSISAKQNYEQGLMTGWLSAWGQATTVIGPPMQWVDDVTEYKSTEDALYAAQCRAANGAMPGLATKAQLEELATARGEAQEKLFLQLMISHHEGAIPMARFALNHGRSTMVRNFALGVMKEQQMEIDWMRQKLQSMANQ